MGEAAGGSLGVVVQSRRPHFRLGAGPGGYAVYCGLQPGLLRCTVASGSEARGRPTFLQVGQKGKPKPPPALSGVGFGPCASRAGALRRTFANRGLGPAQCWAELHCALVPQVLEFVHTCPGWRVLRFGRPRTPPHSPAHGTAQGPTLIKVALSQSFALASDGQ